MPKIVLITGASSDIGEATTRVLSAAGMTVILGARRIDRLERLQDEITSGGGTARVMRLDVTDREAVASFAQSALDEFGRIDVIVNNAGVMPLSRMSSLMLDDWDRMVDVKVKGVLWGIAAVLPVMEAQASGHIINLSAIDALNVSPMAAIYSATNSAVRAISEGLRQENDRIRVTCVYFRGVDPELADGVSDEAARRTPADFRAATIEPEAIGRAILHAIAQPSGVDTTEMIVRPTVDPA